MLSCEHLLSKKLIICGPLQQISDQMLRIVNLVSEASVFTASAKLLCAVAPFNQFTNSLWETEGVLTELVNSAHALQRGDLYTQTLGKSQWVQKVLLMNSRNLPTCMALLVVPTITGASWKAFWLVCISAWVCEGVLLRKHLSSLACLAFCTQDLCFYPCGPFGYFSAVALTCFLLYCSQLFWYPFSKKPARVNDFV